MLAATAMIFCPLVWHYVGLGEAFVVMLLIAVSADVFGGDDHRVG